MTHSPIAATPSPVRRSRFRGAATARSYIPNWLTFEDLPLTLSFLGLLLYTFVAISFKLNIADVAMAAAIFGLVLQGSFSMPKPVLLFIAFTAWAAISSIQGYSPSQSMESIFDQAKLIVIMIVAVNAVRTRGQLQWYLLTYLGTFGTFGVMMSLWFYVRGIRHAGRAVGYGTYANSNDLAAMTLLVVGVAFGVAVASTRNKLVRLAAFGTGMAAIVLIILTQSRGAMLALGLTILPLTLSLIRRNKKMILYAGLAAIVVGAAAPKSAWDRLAGLRNFGTESDLRTVDAEGSAEERWKLVQIATGLAVTHPVFGVGFNAFKAANAVHNPELAHKDTHNTYLNVASETGFVGLALYLALVGTMILHARRTVKTLEEAAKRGIQAAAERAQLVRWLTAGLLAFQAASLFGTTVRFSIVYLYIGILWAACQIELQGMTAPAVTRSPQRVGGRRNVPVRSRTA